MERRRCSGRVVRGELAPDLTFSTRVGPAKHVPTRGRAVRVIQGLGVAPVHRNMAAPLPLARAAGRQP